MEARIRDRISQMVSSDEAPDTGEDSDDDLIMNYMNPGSGTTNSNAATSNNNASTETNFVPAIRITPQSPNGNHVLEDNLLQLSRIQQRIQEMRVQNAQNTLDVNNSGDGQSKDNRLSNSCPSLNNSSDMIILEQLGQIDPTTGTPNAGQQSHYNHSSSSSSRRRKNNMETTPGNRASRHGRHRSVSISSGDSEDEGLDVTDSGKSRQRSASMAPKDNKNSTPPSYNKDRSASRGNRHKSHLVAAFPSLHKSVSTPSIVVNNNSRSKKRYPEPTHMFLQRLISDHEWTSRVSGSDSNSDDDKDEVDHGQMSGEGGYSQTAVGHPHSSRGIRSHPLATAVQSTPSPQLSLAEFLQDDPSNLEDDNARKRRRKKERGSLFFRKKNKDKGTSGPPVIQHHGLVDPSQVYSQRGMAKVSSSIALGANGKPVNSNLKLAHHSHSMSSLRKSSISGVPSFGGQGISGSGGSGNSNFFLSKSDISKPYDELDDGAGHFDTAGLLESEYIPGSEDYVEGGGPAAIIDLETPKHLRIEEEEPERWSQTVSPQTMASLSSADIKRQEHIYEVILTESNQCQVLMVIKRVFVEGMLNLKDFSVPKEVVDRIFPCIDDLIKLHFEFLEELRERQKQHHVVDSIADILHGQFSGETGQRWRETLCTLTARHNDSNMVFKDLMKSDRRFQNFIRQCSQNPLLNRKDVPALMFLVTTRITKYPLLIEALQKAASKDRPAEVELLRQSNIFVRDILRDINARKAEKENKQRLIEILNKIDPKSTLSHEGRKFKKSDILTKDQRLMFEGIATLIQNRSRNMQVNVVVLSDYLFFLHENNGKFYFITPDNKPCLVAVKTLIAKERSGGTTKSLNLLSTEGFEDEPVLYELEISQPPTRDDWITCIRDAVDAASPGSDSDAQDEERTKRKKVDSKYLRLRRLTAELRGKDIELAHVMEAKLRIANEINKILGEEGEGIEFDPVEPLNITEIGQDGNFSMDTLCSTVIEANKLVSSVFTSVSHNLSRSVSSAGEKHSNAYSSPSLPRRAETFNGFDQQSKPKITEIDIQDGGESEIVIQAPSMSEINQKNSASTKEINNQSGTGSSLLLPMEPEQCQAAAQLTRHLNLISCMAKELYSSLHSKNAELSEIKEKATISGGRYKQNERFEEMRRLKENINHEKITLEQKRAMHEHQSNTKEEELFHREAEVEKNERDIKEQREQLYRMLDALRAQGIELGPNLSVLKSDLSTSNKNLNQPQSFQELNSSGSQQQSSPPNVVSGAGSAGLAPGTGSTGIRKSSSLTSSSIARGSSSDVISAANSLATGGSLKKESFANLQLKQEVKQQLPIKLLSSTKEKSSKKSTASLTSAASSSSLSSANKGISNLGKPETVQQLLPFKLSEEKGGGGSGPVWKSQSSVGQGGGSPKQKYQQPQQPQQQQQQQYYRQYAQPRGGSPTGSSASHVYYQQQQQQQFHHVGMGGSMRQHPKHNHHQQQQQQHFANRYPNTTGSAPQNQPTSGSANNDEDKVIYF